MKASAQEKTNRRGGFTLTELVVVLATLAMLAAVLTPALAATRSNGKIARCLNDKRQLTIAWRMYASDNSDLLVSASALTYQSGFMDWTTSSRNTNTEYLTNPSYALIASYLKDPTVFKCPADTYESAVQLAANMGPRVRSVSINGALTGNGTSGPISNGLAPNGGHYFGTGTYGAGSCLKLSYLSEPGPAGTYVFLDEHPDSIDDGLFMFDCVGALATTGEYWRNLPASYHDGAAGISFADGHAEMHQWQEIGGSLPVIQTRQTIYPVIFIGPNGRWGSARTFSNSADYAWMQSHMPYR